MLWCKIPDPQYRYSNGKGGERGVTTVVSRPGESGESLLKRFRKQVTKSGVLSDARKKRWHVSKSEKRRIEKRKAIRRARRKQARRERRVGRRSF